MEIEVSFKSGDVDIVGVLHRPDHTPQGQLTPAVITTHGFGGSKIDGSMLAVCRQLCDWGYLALRLDMRGCGLSGGPRGHVIPAEQVIDLKKAVTWLLAQECVDKDRVLLLGDSMGGAVSLYAGSTDARIAGVVSVGGWGNGAQRLEQQHRALGSWERVKDMLREGREHRERTGKPMMVSRFDIIPIPVHMRGQLPADAIMEFPVETAQGIVDFLPNGVIGRLAPRPLLLIHASRDAVTPTASTVEIFQHAELPKDLVLLSGLDHFPLATGSPRIYGVIKGWLDLYFPLKAAQPG